MSFRKESKSTLNDGKLSILIKWIFQNNGRVLFPERIVNSVYFDNRNLNMYFESVEGVLPRKKIRLRLYKSEDYLKNFLNDTNLEFKISSVEGRYKVSKKNIHQDLKTIHYGKDKSKTAYVLRAEPQINKERNTRGYRSKRVTTL